MTLRQVAQYVDMSNFGPHVNTGGAVSLEDVRRKCDALRQHCAALGRPYEAILRSHIVLPLILAPTRETLMTKLHTMTPTLSADAQAALFSGTPQDLVSYYQALAEAGMQYFIVAIRHNDQETLDLLGREVMPVLAPSAQPARP